MRTFRVQQRVFVREVDGKPVSAMGTVTRVRTDGGAWVSLDKRHGDESVHPFPKGNDRELKIKAYPGDCDLATEDAKGRRRAKRAKGEPEVITRELFGHDHWCTFGYLAIVALGDGLPAREKMRCDVERHPALASAHHVALRGAPSSSRLAGERKLPDHDDWDCMFDLEDAGLLENIGTGANPVVRMTDEGLRVAGLLSDHKRAGGTFATFAPFAQTEAVAS